MRTIPGCQISLMVSLAGYTGSLTQTGLPNFRERYPHSFQEQQQMAKALY